MFTLLRFAAISLALLVSVPTMAAQYQINTTSDIDDGVCDANSCSLREAWNAANATAEADEIKFNIKTGGPQTIALDPGLPPLAAAANSVVIKGKNRGQPVTIVAAHHRADDLFVFSGAALSSVSGLRMVGFDRAIRVESGANVTIERNEFADNNEAIRLGTPWVFEVNGTTAAIRRNTIVNGSYGINSWTASLDVEQNVFDGLTDNGMLIVFPIDYYVYKNVIKHCGRALHYEYDVKGLGNKRGILDNTLTDNDAGIYFAQAHDLHIENNEISSSTAKGIGITQGKGTSYYPVIRNNSMIGLDEGILLLDDNNGLVEDNHIERARTGMANYYGWSTRIMDNRIIDSAETGLAIANDSRVNLVKGNVIDGSRIAGIYVGEVAFPDSLPGPFKGPDLILLEDNVVSNGGGSGIVIGQNILDQCAAYNLANGTQYLCPRPQHCTEYGGGGGSCPGPDYTVQTRVNVRGNSVFDNAAAAPNQAIVLTTGVAPFASLGPLVGWTQPCTGSGSCNPLANDALDADEGANGLQNHPDWTDVRVVYADALTLYGELDSESGQRYRIDFYASPAPNEARTPLGYTLTDVTDAAGHVAFSYDASLAPVGFKTRDGNLYLTMTASRVVCETGACPTEPFVYDPFYGADGAGTPPDEIQMFGATSELSASYVLADPNPDR